MKTEQQIRQLLQHYEHKDCPAPSAADCGRVLQWVLDEPPTGPTPRRKYPDKYMKYITALEDENRELQRQLDAIADVFIQAQADDEDDDKEDEPGP